MSRAGRRTAAAAVTVVALWGMARLSDMPYAAAAVHGAELRLSWRVRSEPERACRRRTAAELARLPAHMREEEVCERRVAPYRLMVMLADSVLEDRLVLSSGARADRPLYVFARFAVAAGTYPLRVQFAREGAASDTSAGRPSPSAGPSHLAPRPPPRQLALDSTLTFEPSRVFVVTYDDEQQRLRLVGEP